MKRFILPLIATVLTLASFSNSYASGPSIIRGNKQIYKESGKICLIKYDTSEMMIEEKSKAKALKRMISLMECFADDLLKVLK